MVNPTDVVQDAELGGLVGLFGGGALEVGIGDVVSEAADDRFGVCGRDDCGCVWGMDQTLAIALRGER